MSADFSTNLTPTFPPTTPISAVPELPRGQAIDNELLTDADATSKEGVLREKQLTVMYKPPQVSLDEVVRIMDCYKKGVPLMNIMRQLQTPRCFNHRPPLIYVDLYTVLFTLAVDGKIVQRSSNEDELTINDFAAFFRIWKNYGSFRDCCKGIIERPTVTCVNYAKYVFRSLGDRYRAEQKLRKKFITPEKIRENHALDHVMKLAVRRKVDEKDALVVFLSDIPLNLQQQLLQTTDGLKYDSTIQTGADVFDRLKSKPVEKTPTYAIQSSPGFRPSPKVNDESDLELLDPNGEMTARGQQQTANVQQEKEQRKRLAFNRPSLEPQFPEHKDDDPGELDELLGQDAGNFTLENLIDDDDPT